MTMFIYLNYLTMNHRAAYKNCKKTLFNPLFSSSTPANHISNTVRQSVSQSIRQSNNPVATLD